MKAITLVKIESAYAIERVNPKYSGRLKKNKSLFLTHTVSAVDLLSLQNYCPPCIALGCRLL